MNIKTIGIDIAKNVFQVHGMDARGKTVLTKRLSRVRLSEFIATLPPCLIGMEACGSSHYWGRKFKEWGHEVKLMNPYYVKPYIKANKNDANDAEGICETVTRPSMHSVPIKSVEQQDIQCLHRIRSHVVQERTALVNQIRSLLAEYGIVMVQFIVSLVKPVAYLSMSYQLNKRREIMKNMKTMSKAIMVSVLFLGLHSHSFATDEQEEIELTQQVKPGFSQLPIELQAYIFSFLEQKEFIRASLVCQSWREAVFVAGEEKTLDLSKRKLNQKTCEALLQVPFSSLILCRCKLGEQEAQILSQFTRIKKLNLKDNRIKAESARALACGKLTSLTKLNLGWNSIGDEGTRALASGNLTALTSLNLGENDIYSEGAAALADGNLTSLTKLVLERNSIKAKGARALACGKLMTLTTLNLGNNKIGDEGARSLARSNFIGLKMLQLRSNYIEVEGAAALSNLMSLTTLDLGENNIGAKGARALANGNLSALTTLYLEETSIGDEGAKALASGNLMAVTTLGLEENSIGKEGAKALARSNFKALTTLGLGKNNIGDEGVSAFASGNLTALMMLDLGRNSIGDEGAKALASDNLTALRMLFLGRNSIGDEGAKALASGNLTALTALYLEGNSIGEEGKAALKKVNSLIDLEF